MSIELLKSISTQKVHKTCNKQGEILNFLGTNHSPEQAAKLPPPNQTAAKTLDMLSNLNRFRSSLISYFQCIVGCNA